MRHNLDTFPIVRRKDEEKHAQRGLRPVGLPGAVKPLRWQRLRKVKAELRSAAQGHVQKRGPLRGGEAVGILRVENATGAARQIEGGDDSSRMKP
jgi:hypothetical protein